MSVHRRGPAPQGYGRPAIRLPAPPPRGVVLSQADFDIVERLAMARPPFDPLRPADDERVPRHEPLRHRDIERPAGCSVLAWLAFALAILVIAWMLVAFAAPRSGQTTADPDSQGGTTAGAGDTAHLSLGSSAGQSGAPQPGVAQGLERASSGDRPPVLSSRGSTPIPAGGAPTSPAVAAPAVFSPAGTLTGPATWYVWRPGQAAAGPRLRAALGSGWRGRTVSVCAGGACVTVRLTDFCACGHGRLIDLDSASFARLAPLSAGVVWVTIGLPIPPAPATDVAP